jgi:hypothetical protein
MTQGEKSDQMPSDHDVVPIASGFHRVLRGLYQVIDCTSIVVTGCLTIVDGDLDAVIANVFTWAWREWKSSHVDTAVASLADFEIKGQDKVTQPKAKNSRIAWG